MAEPTYQVSRNGEVLAVVTASTLAKMLEDGVAKETDAYWTEGMAEWRPISELSEQLADLRKAEKDRLKAEEKQAKEAAKEEKRRLREAAAQAEAEKVRQEIEAAREAFRKSQLEQRLKQPDYGPWRCLDCEYKFEFCRLLPLGSDAVFEGLLFFGGGFIASIVGVSIAINSPRDGLLALGLLGLLGIVLFAQGIARFISGGSLMAIEGDKGRQRCPQCQSHRVIKPPEQEAGAN